MSSIVTRFPPSPTGYLHIGSARTALFNYLFAASQGGTMYLRFEDTDKTRSKKEFENDILEGLAWLAIPYTLPQPFRQSERTATYVAAIEKLMGADMAYLSKEPAKDDPSREVSVVRLRNPGSTVTFTDMIRGEVTFDTKELGDFVIARATDDPLYHLTVVVDDHEMGITHVVRGEDHISNTARQILILEALDYTRPIYAHIPLILAPDRSKLSKRHGAVSVNEYRAQGFLPEALINYLALLGWNPGTDQEIFEMKDLVAKFDIAQVHKGGAIFDIEKLKWFNHEHLKKMSFDEYQRLAKEYGIEHSGFILYVIRERARTFGEAKELIDGPEFKFIKESIEYDLALILKGAKVEAAVAQNHLSQVQGILSSMSDDDYNPERLKDAIFPYAEKEGKGAVLWPLRVALSGQERSPDPFTVASILGKEKSLARVSQAIEKLKSS